MPDLQYPSSAFLRPVNLNVIHGSHTFRQTNLDIQIILMENILGLLNILHRSFTPYD